MTFHFDYFPYIAIIGDIVGSRRLKDRQAVQARFEKVLDAVSSNYETDLASKFMITLGDEFQGLLKAGSQTMSIIDRIEREMHPVKVRFGIGVGKITTAIHFEMPLGADGPAYYNARAMINEIKASESRKMAPRTNVQISIQDHPEHSEVLNTIFSLLTVIKERWTHRQLEIINAYLQSGTQEKAAEKLNVRQENVQKSLSAANFYTYWQTLEFISKVLSELGGDADV